MVGALINWIKDRWYFFTTFFPVQLLLLHFRRSHLLVIFWLVIFGFTSGHIAESYGLRYLFLSPEYLDSVNFFSYFIVGVTLGLFIMAFHISSYIYYAYRYPFLATTSRPLWKFSLNNSFIPGIYFVYYAVTATRFLGNEGISWPYILLFVAAVFLGALVIITITFYYFTHTIRILEDPQEHSKEVGALKAIPQIIKASKKIKPHGKAGINYYLKGPFSIKLARDAGHYKTSLLLDTIQQHHFSASIFFVILIVSIIGLSLISHYSIFMIPAGATIFLIFSLYLMVTGAFYTRLKTWTVTIGILVIVGLNFISGIDKFKSLNYAYGMNYKAEPAIYSTANFDALSSDSIVAYDKARARLTLEKWKLKNKKTKPKLVILNVSGGGLRSALWSIEVLQQLDKHTNGEIYPNIHMITGSSGGMLGAAFYRELKYLQQQNICPIDLNGDSIKTLMAKDLLNPVTYTLAVNDLFFRLKDVSYNNINYPMDRGWSFDKRLNENTLGVLNKTFGGYTALEQNSEMPWMVLGPTIVGDGRKLLMSTLGTSYLTYTKPYQGVGHDREYNAVEFLRLFKNQGAADLSFLTALRLSASFPYITPLVNMPSKPDIQLIDAGVRDNDGFELSLRYIFAMKQWLKENTSGVVILQIKANRPDEIPIKDETVTTIDKMVLPIGGVLKSFHNLQIYNKSLLMELSRDELELPVEVVRFSLLHDRKDVSLSWHLTNYEKQEIVETFDSESNQKAMKALLRILKDESRQR
jgi:hypothetical protein